jgi:hypothetical protein
MFYLTRFEQVKGGTVTWENDVCRVEEGDSGLGASSWVRAGSGVGGSWAFETKVVQCTRSKFCC